MCRYTAGGNSRTGLSVEQDCVWFEDCMTDRAIFNCFPTNTCHYCIIKLSADSSEECACVFLCAEQKRPDVGIAIGITIVEVGAWRSRSFDHSGSPDPRVSMVQKMINCFEIDIHAVPFGIAKMRRNSANV